MASYWGVFLAVVLIIIWLAAGTYITQANIALRDLQNTDNFFKIAYNYTFWAAFITWFLVALFVLLVILTAVGVAGLFSSGAGEAAEGEAAIEEESASSKLYKQYQNIPQPSEGTSWTTILFILLALVLISITGILAAYSAEQIAASTNFTESNASMKLAYDDCVIAAIICLASAGLLILSAIFYFFYGFYNENQSSAATVTPISVTPISVTPISVAPVASSAPVPISITNKQSQLATDFINSKQAELERNFKKGKIIK